VSAEATLYTLLSGLAAGRVFPDVAPEGAALPRVVFQQVGGQGLSFLDGTMPSKENGRMQIACWATTRAAAIALAKQVEAAVCGSVALQAIPLGARASDFEQDTNLYACRQDFSVWPNR
jgi:hypothetical protein